MAAGSNCDILYIEGNPDDVVFFQRAFEKADMPCVVHIVDTIPVAVCYLKGEPPYTDRAAFPIPHLIVTDLAIRLDAGIQFVHWLRSQTAFANIPIICLSSTQDPAKLAAIRHLAVTFVEKSVLFEGVMGFIRAALPI